MPFRADALRNAADQPGWDEPPPPDTYEAELLKAEVFQSKAGEDFVRIGWRVLTGRLEGHEWSHIQTLEEDNEMGLAITARILKAIGVDVDRIQSIVDLPRQLDPLRGGAYSVEVKRNGNYVNTTPKMRLASVQTTMSGVPYGQPPPSGNAVYQGDDPPPPPRSDVPEPGPQDFVHPPAPKKGDIDPETGEPIPF